MPPTAMARMLRNQRAWRPSRTHTMTAMMIPATAPFERWVPDDSDCEAPRT